MGEGRLCIGTGAARQQGPTIGAAAGAGHITAQRIHPAPQTNKLCMMLKL